MSLKNGLQIVKLLVVGQFLILLEFLMYTELNFLVRSQVLIMLVTFYIARFSYQDEEQEHLLRNQIIGVILGISYAIFTDVSPELYAAFFYAIVTFMCKYARNDNAYVIFFNINVLYFCFFLIRIIYFSLMQDIHFDFFNIIITNLFVLTFINSILCFIIAKGSTKKKNDGSVLPKNKYI